MIMFVLSLGTKQTTQVSGIYKTLEEAIAKAKEYPLFTLPPKLQFSKEDEKRGIWIYSDDITIAGTTHLAKIEKFPVG